MIWGCDIDLLSLFGKKFFMDIPQLGLGSGLIPSRQMSGDSTTIPAQVRAIMAKRKEESLKSAPLFTKEDALMAINKGFKGMTQAERDSAAAKFDHEAYEKHLNDMGFQIVKK
jgi:hypothetical protein